ncbi:hypothetical protein RM533_00065 [Croceicoccus sp. F390]|uniref:Glycosyltransferase n=1 Tax=Croceicoccus esteveae TaxID=3075597 RepID=A0ABU2ZD97_9SPHN|nr:hypothetical protein [Croceicoccus sp. F390]MDT0574571.1 hypothetical protein [Croceicoccus sp. F390]
MNDAPTVLMFYDGYERKARENILPRTYHALRCTARAAVRRMRGQQVNTGFYEAFLAVVKGLGQLGCKVRINDYAAARKNPDYPIGLAGYPEVIEQVRLTNPIIFGPGDPGYPDVAGRLAKSANVKHIIQPSDWYVQFYEPFCPGKMLRCPVGIDLDAIAEPTGPKSIDVLIYDKIRWHRKSVGSAVRDRLIKACEDRGLSYKVLRYGHHTQQSYFATLAKSRSMAFLCEHETQGLACEEALAMNVPVFAWDEGRLIDPLQQPFASADLRPSSVPYFDERCGMVFTINDMEDRLDLFLAGLPDYLPRSYVAEILRPSETARVYLDAYSRYLP